MADSGVWRWQLQVLRAQFPGIIVTSTYRPDSLGSTGRPDYHSQGKAIDIQPRMDVFNWIAGTYSNSAELIYTPAGNRQLKNGKPFVYSAVVAAQHYSHIHWAMESAGVAPPLGIGMPNIPGPIDDAASQAVGAIKTLGEVLAFLTDPHNWLRIAMALGGVVLIIMAVLSWGKDKVLSVVGSK